MIPQARPTPCIEFSSNCSSATTFQLFLLCTSLLLMSIGAGGIRSASLAFGADQLKQRDGKENSGSIKRYISWYYASTMFSVFIAFGCIVYIQENMGWKVGFGIPALLMFISALSFFMASSLYVKLKARSSLVTELIQVMVATYQKRNVKLSPNANYLYHLKEDSNLVLPSEKLRFLNRGCIVLNPQEELNPDGTARDPWSLCKVDQVEDLKSIIKGKPTHLGMKQRMGIDIVLGCVSIIIKANVETIRRNRATAEVDLDDPKAIVSMSAMWLVPQLLLSGFAEGLSSTAQYEFFYMELPRSMTSISSTLFQIGFGMANLLSSLIMTIVDDLSIRGGNESWLSSNINRGHYDYYYWVIAGFCMVDMILFLICSKAYGPCK